MNVFANDSGIGVELSAHNPCVKGGRRTGKDADGGKFRFLSGHKLSD